MRIEIERSYLPLYFCRMGLLETEIFEEKRQKIGYWSRSEQ